MSLENTSRRLKEDYAYIVTTTSITPGSTPSITSVILCLLNRRCRTAAGSLKISIITKDGSVFPVPSFSFGFTAVVDRFRTRFEAGWTLAMLMVFAPKLD
jgi:hypothetical protein